MKIDNKRKNEDDEEKGQKSATIFTIKVFTMVFTILRKFEIWGQFHQNVLWQLLCMQILIHRTFLPSFLCTTLFLTLLMETIIV